MTTNDNQDESPASPDSQSASQTVNSRFAQSPASEPATILYTDRIDLLIKQNELQRQMILEMVQSMPSKTESATNFLNGASSLEWTPQTSASSSSDISTVKNLTDSTVESREFQSFADVSQHAVQTDRMMGTLISQVNLLRKENEALRKENSNLKGDCDLIRKDILLLKSEIAQK